MTPVRHVTPVRHAVVEQAGRSGKAMTDRDPSYWHGIHAIDADFFLLVMDETIDTAVKDKINEIILRYKEQFDRYGNANYNDSVRSQFEYCLKFAIDQRWKRIFKQMHDGLK